MANSPNFLPPTLSLRGSWYQILEVLYRVFDRDFKKYIPNHDGLPIIFDRRISQDGDGKEEGFWHVITKVDYKSGDRLPDYDRAKRLPWARPIMESPTRSEIKVFDYDHGSSAKGIRRYIWLENFDYVLVLTRRRTNYFWLTAFFVTKGSKRDLANRYNNRVI
jgi:hypothetical protein